MVTGDGVTLNEIWRKGLIGLVGGFSCVSTVCSDAGAIPGAFPSSAEQWPEVVRVGQCTGVIVHPTFVVVPAHCLTGTPPAVIEWSPRIKHSTHTVAVVRCWSDPEYPAKVPEHDIGLCLLTRPLQHVRIPTLGELTSAFEGRKPAAVRIVGYASHGWHSAQQIRRNTKKDELFVPSVSSGLVVQIPTAFTVSISTGRNSACFGDSGSAVYVNGTGDKRRLIGLISGPESSACRGHSIAVRIKPHLRWIETTISREVAR